ncbi:hypothetical protein [Mycobacterium sp. 852002-51961_SCH5331710]|uniref:hypothetical protein n=1 Tax=Mycobacterium sp. 852002-51961_SCH5331710 TaxID=1834105 RepID=UPI0009EE055E|nr:hypothetical protein [Mycobacterium sp. 852002-51961_SCH5331710]
MSISTVDHRTRAVARILGPYLTIVAVVVLFRTPDMRILLTEFTETAVWPWVMGAFILLGGIAIVATHQTWRGPAAVIVSVLGWLLVARGVLLLAFPETFAELANRTIDAGGVWRSVVVVLGLVGLYLTYVSWRPPSREHDVAHEHRSTDTPRAA